MDGFLQLLLTSAALAGLLGGAHCAAMCGGIVTAVCGSAGARLPWARTLTYNLGRIASYAAAGAIVGGLGHASLAWRGEAALREGLMLAAGVTLVMLAVFLAGWSPAVRLVEAAGGVLWRRVQPLTRHVLPANTLPRALGLGLLWGWLPCGMVYAVLLTAAATGDARDGALVMAVFGLGTLPNLVAIAAFARTLQRYAQRRVLRLAGAAVIAAFGVYGIAHAIHPGIVGALAGCLTGGTLHVH